ncbi:MAG: hypothetical protein EA364_12515 [Balneolaceae bacterium]|nr:MAG: hypothetical protein EA364_12515 [Balneolaceae bacterium]
MKHKKKPEPQTGLQISGLINRHRAGVPGQSQKTARWPLSHLQLFTIRKFVLHSGSYRAKSYHKAAAKIFQSFLWAKKRYVYECKSTQEAAKALIINN